MPLFLSTALRRGQQDRGCWLHPGSSTVMQPCKTASCHTSDGQLAEHIPSKTSQPGRGFCYFFVKRQYFGLCCFILDPVISNSSSQQGHQLQQLALEQLSPANKPISTLPAQPSPPCNLWGACFLAFHFHTQRLQQQIPTAPSMQRGQTRMPSSPQQPSPQQLAQAITGSASPSTSFFPEKHGKSDSAKLRSHEKQKA